MYELEEKSKIIDGYKIQSKGIFNFEELYKEMHNWFKHYSYDWKELEYKKVENPDNTQTVELRWECPKKVDNYVSMLTSIFIQARIGDVDVNIGNEKKRMNSGYVMLQFNTVMLKNVSSWKGKPMGQLSGLIYEKILIKDRLRAYEDEIRGETMKLMNEVKEYLQIYAR